MRTAAIAVLVLAASPALAADPVPPPAEEGLAVTVYSAPGGGEPRTVYDYDLERRVELVPGFSIVKERRRVVLAGGRSAVRFEDVAARIDGSTVTFKSLTDPAGTSVLEQGFEYDLASADRILEKHVGREAAVMLAEGGEIRGRLLSFDEGDIVLAGEKLQVLRRGEAIRGLRFEALPEGLVTRPTLTWLVQAARPGEHLAEVAYETSDMSWSADYTAVVSPDEKSVDLSAWVTVRNGSGATYRDAALKLVAGDLHRAPRGDGEVRESGLAFGKTGEGSAGFREKAFFEYHLYTLGRRTTIPDRSVKQIELFEPVAGVPCRKVFLYDGLRGQEWGGEGPNADQGFGSSGSPKVGVFLELENRKESRMGMPLPAGRMRIHKRDEADGFPELIGEDRIDHTPKDEIVRLKVGDAFDIVGERRATDFACDMEAHWIRESVEIRLRNRKAEDVDVLVAERMHRWVQWEVVEKSRDFVKKDAGLVHFPVRVPKDGEVVITYTVQYTW